MEEDKARRYFAHTAGDGRMQTVKDHLLGTAELARDYAQAFGAGEQGYLAGLLHDIGKYSDAFQAHLLHGGPKVDHATAGAWECLLRDQPCCALAVAGHHGRLPDWGSLTDMGGSFLGRMHKAISGELPPYEPWKQDVPVPAVVPFQDMTLEEGTFFTRMLYSCLVDGDRTDTERFQQGGEEMKPMPDMDTLWTRFQKHIASWFPPEGRLNRQRWAILQRCMEEGQNREPGLFTLTAPTGSGKTTASLAFALAQAKRNRSRRIVYVIPYTSVIEQTAMVFRDILGEEAVLEHHSGAEREVWQEGRLLAGETWDRPVIVTTAVQFFESLYSSRASRCRKLHNLAGSVLLFDEAQMLPLHVLRPCVFAISQLVKHYGASAVLCTATQPALGPLFEEFLPAYRAAELCPPEIIGQEVFKRVNFRRDGTLAWGTLADRMKNLHQVLCVVNSRKSAGYLFRLLEPEGRFHLSGLMCPAHRKEKLAEIQRRLEEGKSCRVASTSLIEAGVDVDFPRVFREEAGLDSILQSAGRCNREGRRRAEESLVVLFRSAEPPPPLLRTAIGVGGWVMDHFEDIESREAICGYFRELLEVKGIHAQDQQGLMALMEGEVFPFRKLEEGFSMLGSPGRTVYIPWDEEGKRLTGQLLRGVVNRKLFRKLGQYGVHVYPRQFEALEKAGVLEVSAYGAVLRDMAYYSGDTGLRLEAREDPGGIS